MAYCSIENRCVQSAKYVYNNRVLTHIYDDDQQSAKLKGSALPRIQPKIFGLRLLLISIFALLLGTLAYQAPARSDILIGWPGDRLFLNASEGWSSGDALRFYGDELTPDAPYGRSRWTHQGAELVLQGPGQADLTFQLQVQGWPGDVLNPIAQPRVSVLANGQYVGDFIPSSDWTTQRFSLPSTIQASDELRLTLQSNATFTGTQTYQDLRPKGLRVAALSLEGGRTNTLSLPPLMPVGLLILSGGLAFLALGSLTRRHNLSFVLTIMLLVALGLGLVMARIWVVALLPWLLLSLLLLLIWSGRHVLAGYLMRLSKRWARSDAAGYGILLAVCISISVASIELLLTAQTSASTIFKSMFPDSLLIGLLALCLLGLGLVSGRRGMPNIARRLAEVLNGKPGLWLCVAFLLVWLLSLASINASMPYVGHADYADNAVVARNLISGRGWVVDYVTQFYRLYDGITRPQETWPLLQPVWIAPFFLLLGVTSWVAKIPNLIFIGLLGVLVYRFGAAQWGRRVGLTAVIMLLTSHLFFKLAIYVTSDLAFVVFAFGALTLLYRWSIGIRDRGSGIRGQGIVKQQLFLSGLLTGLMVVQKPGSGGLIALGMGLWILKEIVFNNPQTGVHSQTWPAPWQIDPSAARRQMVMRGIGAVVLWASLAGLIIAPLIWRNMHEFGKPYFSTESYDAWILEYTDWDRIYGVYAPELSTSGVPDRSWILRWGFDRSLHKLTNQLEATRDYLLPAWPGLWPGLSGLTGRADKDIRLLFDMGAWLALIGFIQLALQQSRLPGLLLFAFTPYVLFLIVYWHANEERYFVVIMPWLALLAALTLWQLYERIARLSEGRWAALGLLVVSAGLVYVISPSWDKIEEKVYYEPQLYAADLDAYSWLKAHTPDDAVMMTRNPWQLNWTAERPAVMIPYTTERDTFLRIAKHYKVRYLVLDSLQRPEPEVRKLIDELLADSTLGFKEVYRTQVYPAAYGDKRTQVFAEIYQFP